MNNPPTPLFWDSCNFIRYATGAGNEEFVDDLSLFIDESRGKNPRWKIYYSTIVLAEFRPSLLKSTKFGGIDDFFDDFGSAFYPIDPNPVILADAGRIKDIRPHDKSNPRMPSKRVVGTPDAIHLATCLFARDVLGISDISFQTLDKGKGSSWEGKCLPLVGLEDWFPPEARCDVTKRVLGLKRELPKHPEPRLIGLVGSKTAASSVGN
ncbi:MAG: hypothetical protein ABL308_12170 [Oceanicaulis sp.]